MTITEIRQQHDRIHSYKDAGVLPREECQVCIVLKHSDALRARIKELESEKYDRVEPDKILQAE